MTALPGLGSLPRNPADDWNGAKAGTPAGGWECRQDDLIGAGEDRGRHGQAERLRGLEIDDQLEPGRLLDRQIGGLCALQNPSSVYPLQTVYLPEV